MKLIEIKLWCPKCVLNPETCILPAPFKRGDKPRPHCPNCREPLKRLKSMAGTPDIGLVDVISLPA